MCNIKEVQIKYKTNNIEKHDIFNYYIQQEQNYIQ